MMKTKKAIEVAVLLLAAGSSERMGEKNKLLLPVDGEAMVLGALRAAYGCGADLLCLLTGHERESILTLAGPFNFTEAYNPDFMLGQDKSIAVGLEKLQRSNRSVLVMLADQPRLSAALLSELILAHRQDGGHRALVPTYRGQWGTPRILPAVLVSQAVLAGGGLSMRKVLSESANVQLYEVDDRAVVVDIDTPDDYLQFTQG